ncbi:MAG: polysaccharide deacetylase [Sphingomonadaceae bacterium]|nr:polysaccharide deacetylase [Sphingomonadaceae bacterium]
MATRVLLTIDTELTWRHHAPGKGWERNYALSVEPARVGLSYQLAKLRSCGLNACFFVDPMPAAIFGIAPVERMVKTILDAGQEVQLHLHPMWTDTDAGGNASDDTVFELIDHGFERQKALIEQARNWLVAAGAPDPIAFRSGSYAVDDDTMRALAQLGIRYDASHNGCEGPWPSALSLPLDQVAPVEHHGVIELPVSQMRTQSGGLRHMQICAVSLGEMAAGLDHAVANDHPLFMAVGHSFELASRDGKRANAIVKRRFDGLCEILAARSGEIPTSHLADLPELRLDMETEPAPASLIQTGRRMAEQLWSNLIAERAA